MRIFFAVWINCGFSKPFPPHLIKFMLEILMLNSLANSNFKVCKKFLFYSIMKIWQWIPTITLNFWLLFRLNSHACFTISDMISKFLKLSKSSQRKLQWVPNWNYVGMCYCLLILITKTRIGGQKCFYFLLKYFVLKSL